MNVMNPKEAVLDRIRKLAARNREENERAEVIDEVSNGIPRSIERKQKRRWTDERFSRFCLQVLGYPGLRSEEDDKRVADEMDDLR